MLEWIETIMNTLGYPGIAMLMFLEVVFPPIPSELIMPLGGFASNRGSLNIVGVITAGTAGSMAGAVLFYYVGKIVGTERLVVLADKYGKWLTVSGEDVKKADHWFDRHGEKVVLFCRLVPGIRSLVSLPAGVAKMKMLPFLLYTLIGTLIWNIALTGAGHFLGQNYDLVEQYMGDSGKIVLGILVALAVIFYAVRLVQQKKKEDQKKAANASESWQPSQSMQRIPPQQAWTGQAQQSMPGMQSQQAWYQQQSWPGTSSQPQQPSMPTHSQQEVWNQQTQPQFQQWNAQPSQQQNVPQLPFPPSPFPSPQPQPSSPPQIEPSPEQ